MLDLQPYLHQLMPALVTCLVAKRISASPLEDHWALRRHAAALMHEVVRCYGGRYAELQPRTTKTLLEAPPRTKPSA